MGCRPSVAAGDLPDAPSPLPLTNASAPGISASIAAAQNGRFIALVGAAEPHLFWELAPPGRFGEWGCQPSRYRGRPINASGQDTPERSFSGNPW